MKKALLISCFDWYKTRLEPIRELLIKHGYSVITVQSDYDHLTKTELKIRYPECTYIHVPPYSSNMSVQRIRSHLSFGKTIEKFINTNKPELIYIQIPPNNTAKYCTKYKKENPKTQLILDIVDLWPESMPIGALKESALLASWKKWRTNCIEVADHIFTECELYQERLQLDRKRTSTLYLFKNQNKEERDLVLETIKRKEAVPARTIKFAYLGSMNSIIDIDEICKTIKCCSNTGIQCELHAIGSGESKDQFIQAVSDAGCKAYFYDSIFDEMQKIKILASCDYAFNMMKSDISVGLTMKSIDYLSYGIPLINNIQGDTWRIVEEKEVGINIDSLDVPLKTFDHCRVVEEFYKMFSRESFMKTIEEVLS